MDKETLLKQHFQRTNVDIPGVGVVIIRSLSRQEMLSADTDLPVLQLERRMLSFALLDPVLTEDEVGIWQASSPAAEIALVITAINELSGITRSSAKEVYKSV